MSILRVEGRRGRVAKIHKGNGRFVVKRPSLTKILVMKVLAKVTAGSKDSRNFIFAPKLTARHGLKILQGIKLFLFMGFNRLSVKRKMV